MIAFMTEVLPPTVDCHGVSIRFPDRGGRGWRTVVDQLDIHVAASEIVVLLGKSGCGKSTLLRAIAGLQPIEHGSIAIDGNSVEMSKNRLAFVFQEAALLPWRTALENVCLPLELQSAGSSAELRAKAARLLETVEFSQADHHKFPSQLSGGMKMRASLARALVTDPALLLLDEPFAALDDMLRWRLNELILQQNAIGRRTVIFVTHNIAEAVFLSRRIAIMHRGKIAAWLDNELPYPRISELRATTGFARMYGQISQRLAEIAEGAREVD
jgi:NitT/TauT family transport system ATP-binding protein